MKTERSTYADSRSAPLIFSGRGKMEAESGDASLLYLSITFIIF
jgi:hypothetical protein